MIAADLGPEHLLAAIDAVLHTNASAFTLTLDGAWCRVAAASGPDRVVRAFPLVSPSTARAPHSWVVPARLRAFLRTAKSTGARYSVLTLAVEGSTLTLRGPTLTAGVEVSACHVPPAPPPFQESATELPAGVLREALQRVVHGLSNEAPWSGFLYAAPTPKGTELLALRPHQAARVTVPGFGLPDARIFPRSSVERLLDFASERSPLEAVTHGLLVSPEVPIFHATAWGNSVQVHLPPHVPPPETDALFAAENEWAAEVEAEALVESLGFLRGIERQEAPRDVFTLDFEGTALRIRYTDGTLSVTRTLPARCDGRGTLRIRGENLQRALRPLGGPILFLADPKSHRLRIEVPADRPGLTNYAASLAVLR